MSSPALATALLWLRRCPRQGCRQRECRHHLDLVHCRVHAVRHTLGYLMVVYRIWSSRMARHLATWGDAFFPSELVGGRSGSPPAVVTANFVSAHLACAHAEGSPQAGACLDTIRCFDSVSLLRLRVLLEACGAPRCLFEVLQLWQGLERHIWTGDGPTGCTVRLPRQRGLPQGDAIAPWALNLVMGAWLQHLPVIDLVRVYLDDRCLIDASPGRIALALERTQAFDQLFGMEIHPRKSVRFQFGNPRCQDAARWLALPECTVIKYLGVALQTTLVTNFELGDSRATAVKAKILRGRALPEHDTRRALLPSFLQGLYSEGVALSKRVTDSLSTHSCLPGMVGSDSACQELDAQCCIHSWIVRPSSSARSVCSAALQHRDKFRPPLPVGTCLGSATLALFSN